MQPDLFSIPVHGFENNSESQKFLDRNKKKLSDKCNFLLTLLLSGKRLTFIDAIHTIGDLRRRSLDLIEAGYKVEREWAVKDSKRQDYKVYYMSSKEIDRVKQLK